MAEAKNKIVDRPIVKGRKQTRLDGQEMKMDQYQR